MNSIQNSPLPSLRPSSDTNPILRPVVREQVTPPDAPLFGDPEAQGVDPLGDTPQVSLSDDPDAPPDQVAAYVKYNNLGMNPELGRSAYLEAIYLHQDDAEWLAAFYGQLGPEASAQVISQTVDPSTHWMEGGHGVDPELALRQVESVRHSLETLQSAGYLDQAGLANLLAAFPDNDSIVHATNEIFGKGDGELQEMFFQAASGLDSDRWNAGALQILNGLPAYRQDALLSAMDGPTLDRFIAGAMAGEAEVYTFEDSVRHGLYTNLVDENYGEIDKVLFGGVGQLLETANNVTVYYHARTVVPDFSASLQNALFVSVSKALDQEAIFDKFRDDAPFKTELGELFIRNGASILAGQAPDGAFVDSEFLQGMTKFFEITLFTQHPGENREALMENVLTTMSDVGDASQAPPLDIEAYRDAHNGWSQQDHVEVMGGLQGMILQAASNQKGYLEGEILKDREQRLQMIGFVTGMALAFLPGASTMFGQLAADGASWIKQVPDKALEYAVGQGQSQIDKGAQDLLIGVLSGAGDEQESLAEVNAFIEMFRNTIVSTSSALPNGEPDELNLRTAFQSAFSFYHELVSF